MQLIRNRIIRNTVAVFVFWWIILTIQTIVTNQLQYSAAFDNLSSSLGFTVFGIAIGVVYMLFELNQDRKRARKSIEGETLRGLRTTIGKVPVFQKPAPFADYSLIPYPPEVPAGFITEWIASIQKTHPTHAALAKKLLGIYAAHKHYPATHLAGGHGGRTLFEHSILVAWQCHQLIQTWNYKGLMANRKHVLIAPSSEKFILNRDDPLFVLAGLAHDLGKIECFKWEGDKVVDSLPIHDSVSARMLSRLDEYWALPIADRSALNMAVGFYHKPDRISLRPDGSLDDKAVALMELLIRADNSASRMEMGEEIEHEDAADAPQVSESEHEKIWNAFQALVNDVGRVNNEDNSVNLGQKNSDEQGRALIYFHEESLRNALGQTIKEDIYGKGGDGLSALTRKLLEVLSEKGCLLQNHLGHSYTPSRSVFKVEFLVKDKKFKQASLEGLEPAQIDPFVGMKVVSTWPAVIIIYADEFFPGISGQDDYISVPRIAGPYFGSRSGKKDAPEVRNITDTSFDPDSDESFTIVEGTKGKAKAKKVSQAAEAETAAKVHQEASSTPSPPQAAGDEAAATPPVASAIAPLKTDESTCQSAVAAEPSQATAPAGVSMDDLDAVMSGQIGKAGGAQVGRMPAVGAFEAGSAPVQAVADAIRPSAKTPQNIAKAAAPVVNKPATQAIDPKQSAKPAPRAVPAQASFDIGLAGGYEPPTIVDDKRLKADMRKILRSINNASIKSTTLPDGTVIVRLSSGLQLLPESDRGPFEDRVRSGGFPGVYIAQGDESVGLPETLRFSPPPP